MNMLPAELIQYIGKFISNIAIYKTLNKEFYSVSKLEHFKRICNTRISKSLSTKQKIILDNDIYDNPSQLLSTGIYKIFSTNSHHHLFIRLDVFQSYMYTWYTNNIEDNIFMYEPVLLYINGILTPGKISFERFLY